MLDTLHLPWSPHLIPSGVSHCLFNKQNFFFTWKQPFFEAEAWIWQSRQLWNVWAWVCVWQVVSLSMKHTFSLDCLQQPSLAMTHEIWSRMGSHSSGGRGWNWQTHYSEAFRLCLKGNESPLCHRKYTCMSVHKPFFPLRTVARCNNKNDLFKKTFLKTNSLNSLDEFHKPSLTSSTQPCLESFLSYSVKG